MRGNSNTVPDAIVKMHEGRYQVRWNIVRNDRKNEDGTTVESYDFECNHVYSPDELTKYKIVLAIVREKYAEGETVPAEYGAFANNTADEILVSG